MAKGDYTDGKVKLTVRLDPELVKRAKVRAIELGTSVQELVRISLREALKIPIPSRRPSR